ncbi:hypothetical protein [Thalassotalea agarivorans]|uniref:hypothetical protein n=1 Tax=Thalassotalea agarivorans TaxID=349064 RepID=UPI00115FC722|nr:hypothetical protein [Thalassotalea agarivorans]
MLTSSKPLVKDTPSQQASAIPSKFNDFLLGQSSETFVEIHKKKIYLGRLYTSARLELCRELYIVEGSSNKKRIACKKESNGKGEEKQSTFWVLSPDIVKHGKQAPLFSSGDSND